MLIVFEGIGGSGKSTLAARLARHLESSGWDVVRTREPGGTQIGEVLRTLLLGGIKMDAWSEAFLFEADRAQTYSAVIEPSLRDGRIVVSDRGPFGTVAYQGHGRRLDISLIEAMSSAAWRGRLADLVFVCDVEPDLAMARKAGSLEPDPFDAETLSFQRRVRAGYLEAAKRFRGAADVIDVSQDADTVFYVVRDAVERRLTKLA
jgi:dTMP kinase